LLRFASRLMPTPAPARRRTRQTLDKRDAILSAALSLFSRFGMHGTSLDQVAARAEVSKSNLLYHFESKEALYVAVLRQLLHVWLEPLNDLNADQPPDQALAAYIRSKLTLSRDQPDASRLFCLEMIQGAPLLRDELARDLSGSVSRTALVIGQWVKRGQLRAIDPHHLLFSLWAVTQHYADFAVQVHTLTGKTLDHPEFFEQTVQSVVALFLQGLRPDQPTVL
jgi:TetR/AcrR family transcriptional regulator